MSKEKRANLGSTPEELTERIREISRQESQEVIKTILKEVLPTIAEKAKELAKAEIEETVKMANTKLKENTGSVQGKTKISFKDDPLSAIQQVGMSLFEVWEKVQARKDPLTLLEQIAKDRPALLSLYTPDPLSGQIPMLMGKASAQAWQLAYNAGIKAGRSEQKGGKVAEIDPLELPLEPGDGGGDEPSSQSAVLRRRPYQPKHTFRELVQ